MDSAYHIDFSRGFLGVEPAFCGSLICGFWDGCSGVGCRLLDMVARVELFA